MLPARLFAGLAIMSLCFVGLTWLMPQSSIDIYSHDAYFVLGPALLPSFCVVASLNFAVLYYAAVRFFHAKWNRALSILHFSLFVCFGILWSIVFMMSGQVTNGTSAAGGLLWVAVPGFVGLLSLFLCFVVFGVNLTLTVVQVLRARFASH